MKKLISIIIVSVLLVCMAACSPTDKDTDNAKVGDICNTLNELVWKDYSKVKINIVTDTGFAKLSSEYVLTQTAVTYSVEKLNSLSLEWDVADLSDSYKTTYSGSAKVEDGRIVEFDGSSDIALPSLGMLSGEFCFDEENLRNAVLSDGAIKADVISPSEFYGTDTDISGLQVNVEYSANAIIKITLSYDTSGATVTAVYSFES